MFKEQMSLEVSAVDCPKDVKVEKGKTVECTVTVKPSGKVPVVIDMTDDAGSVSAKTKHKVLVPATLAKAIEDKAGGGTKVDCGTEVRVAAPDTKFTCTATNGGDKKDVAVVVDKDGMANWSIPGGAAPAAEPAADAPAPEGDDDAADEE